MVWLRRCGCDGVVAMVWLRRRRTWAGASRSAGSAAASRHRCPPRSRCRSAGDRPRGCCRGPSPRRERSRPNPATVSAGRLSTKSGESPSAVVCRCAVSARPLWYTGTSAAAVKRVWKRKVTGSPRPRAGETAQRRARQASRCLEFMVGTGRLRRRELPGSKGSSAGCGHTPTGFLVRIWGLASPPVERPDSGDHQASEEGALTRAWNAGGT